MNKPKLIVPIGHTNVITSVAFSPDGQLLLTGSQDQTAKLWDRTGRELMTFPEQSYFIYAVAFSPKGQYIATGSNDRAAKVWEVETGEVALRLEGHEKAIYDLTFSPDGKRLLTGSGDGTAAVWNARRGNRQAVLAGHEAAVRAVAFSPDGKQALTGGDDRKAILWDVRGKKPIHSLEGHAKTITSVAFSADGRYLLTGSMDRTVRIWAGTTGKLLHTFEDHHKGIRAATFSPDGKKILTAGEDGRAVIREWMSDKRPLILKEHRASIGAVAFAPDGRAVLTGSRDQTARLWDVENGKEIAVLKGHARSITDVDFSADESRILTADEALSATVWDVDKGRTVATIRGHAQPINTVSFSPGDRFILTASEDGTARIWDAGSGAERSVLRGHEKAVKSAVFSGDGQWVATGSADRTAKLWNWATGVCLSTFTGHSGTVNDLALSANGKYLLTGSSDRTARIWDTSSGEILHTLEGHENIVRSVAFSPDDRWALTASYDNTARIWSVETGDMIRELTGHRYDVRVAVFSPDGQRVLTGSYDETAKVWDAATGECLLTLEGHESAPRAVAFSPHGNRILTGSRDNMVKIWDAIWGKEQVSLVQIGDEDWVVTTPSGLFDASARAMELMYYVLPYQDKKRTEWVIIELEQLKERYYEPGLLAKIMGFRKGEIREVAEFGQVALFPRVEAEIKADRLHVRLSARNGGLGKISLFVNQKEVLEDANPDRKTNLAIDLKRYGKYFHPDQPNAIGLLAYNEEGWLRSEMMEWSYTPAGAVVKGAGKKGRTGKPARGEPQHLHAIVVGTSRYDTRGIKDLNFPDKDAADVAAAVELAGNIFFPGPPQVQLLTSDAGEPEQLSTKKNIRTAFERVAAEAKPQDVFLLYFSGHGANYGSGDKAQFYYLTRDLPTDNLHDPAIRKLGAISSAELTEWIKDIPAGKQVLILDTCHAGKIVDSLAGGRSLDNSLNIRALDRMKDRTGMFVLAGSAADHFSYEASIFGQGLLTYSLLLGMKGGALLDDLIDVSRLFQFARNKVPEFAETIYQRQEPVVAVPRGGDSFYLGKVDDHVRRKIHIAEPKPVLIASILLDGEAFNDPLRLSAAVDEHFRLLHARGKVAPFVFIDLPELDVGHYVRGLYRQKAGHIKLQARVFKGDRDIGRFAITGNDREELANKVAEAVIGVLGEK